MEPMLTQDDLKSIGTIVEEKIDTKIDALEARMNVKFDAVQESLDGIESRMDTKFDAVQESLDSIENRMVTKSYLDDKLAHYVPKPF